MHLECKRCVELFDVSDVMSLTSYDFDRVCEMLRASPASYSSMVVTRAELSRLHVRR